MPSALSSEKIDFDSMKFVALERFMSRLDEADTVGRDVDELQYDFMERCDRVLMETISECVKREDVVDFEDAELRSTLSSQLDLALEDAVSLPALIQESLFILEAMEDVTDAWLSVVLFDEEKLKELYGLVQALGEDQEEYHANQTLRDLIMEFVYASPLLTGEDWMRFHLLIEHMSDEAVIWVMNRFLNGHLEYIQVLQVRCLDHYPELAQKVRSRLLKEASLFAKRLG
jgi:hypothetical protein